MNKKGVKIVTIGGGSSYTPELVEGFIKRYHELPIRELWFVDVNDGKEKQDIVGKMAKRMIEAAKIDCKVFLTLDISDALKDADFVTTQFRVGLLEARAKDERIPNQHGMLGQETNGAGGIFKAFRTIPVILDIVEKMKVLCPDAWLINFTNPSGMVTEAVIKYGKWDKVIGLCNVPIGVEKNAALALGKNAEDLNFKSAGLNHFIWTKVYDKQGNDLTMKAIEVLYSPGEKPAELANVVANITRVPLQYEQIRNLGMLPCPYHQYYYATSDSLKKQLQDLDTKGTRAEQVQKVETELFEIYKDVNLDHKPKQLAKRGGAHYSDAACELISSIYNDKGTLMTVSTINNGSITDLPYDCVVEVSCNIFATGPQPINIGKLPTAQKGLLQVMKSMEELTIEASVTGNYDTALQAFTINPLITSGQAAKDLLDAMLESHKDYLPQFFKK